MGTSQEGQLTRRCEGSRGFEHIAHSELVTGMAIMDSAQSCSRSSKLPRVKLRCVGSPWAEGSFGSSAQLPTRKETGEEIAADQC